MFPRPSTASTGISPINVTRCGLPSTPAMISSVLRTFTRSHACGWTCQVQPLPTTKVMPRRPVPRALWREALRRLRPTGSARAHKVGPRARAGARVGGDAAACASRYPLAEQAISRGWVVLPDQQRFNAFHMQSGSRATNSMSAAALGT
eukprot:6173539-Pleurochrysis_carterae.AAC.1